MTAVMLLQVMQHLFLVGVSVMKIDDNDNIIWNTSLNTLGNSSIDQLESIQETNDGGFIFIATSDQKIALVKLDYFGNIVWSELIGDSGSYGVEVRQTQDNGFIVIGEYNGNILLIKTNSFGMLEWYNYFLSNDWEKKEGQ